MRDPEDPGEGPADHRFIPTQKMRVRAKNPQIERKATLREDSNTVASRPAGRPDDGHEREVASEAGARADHSDAALPRARTERETPVGAVPGEPRQAEGSESSISLYDQIEQSGRPAELEEARAQLEAALWAEPTEEEDNADPRVAPTEAIPAPERAPTVLAQPPPVADPAAVERKARPARPPEPDRRPTVPAGQAMDDDETVVSTSRRASPPEPQGALPRARFIGGGTKAVGAQLRRQKLMHGAELPQVAAPALKTYAGFVETHHLERLDNIVAGRFDADESDEPSMRRGLEGLIHDRHFLNLSLEDRAALLTTVADHPRCVATVTAALALVRTGIIAALRSEDRDALHAVFGRLDGPTRARLAQVARRPVNGASALEDRAADGGSTLAHLQAIVRGTDVDPNWAAQGLRLDVVGQLIVSTLAEPCRISLQESNEGVTGVLELALADQRPAELARLWRQVLARQTSVVLAGGRTWPTAELDQRPRAPTPLRGLLQALPESLSRPAQGYIAPERSAPDRLNYRAVADAAGQLFGCEYPIVQGPPGLARLRAHRPMPHAPAWLSVTHAAGERLFLFDRADETFVYLRGPIGRSTKTSGHHRRAPSREVVDPGRGLDRIALRELHDRAGVALIPRARP